MHGFTVDNTNTYGNKNYGRHDRLGNSLDKDSSSVSHCCSQSVPNLYSRQHEHTPEPEPGPEPEPEAFLPHFLSAWILSHFITALYLVRIQDMRCNSLRYKYGYIEHHVNNEKIQIIINSF